MAASSTVANPRKLGAPPSAPSLAVSLGLALVALAVFVVIVRAAWLCDDAYITIRTVDNFVHGYGLRWNVGERVQAYTHPLWMWALVPGTLVTGSARITLLATCLVAALGALALVVRAGRGRPVLTAAVLVGLAGSKSFVEYSTSGLEEGLLFCLVAVIVPLMVVRAGERRRAALAVFLASLLFLTRMDAVIIVTPLVLWCVSGGWRGRPLVALFAAAAPAVLWLVFATFYYGAPFPNTAYAKLGHGIARSALVAQGFRYLSDFWLMDPAGTAMIASGLVWSLVRRSWLVPAGIVLWIGYVVWIGGDFMSGRMLAPAVFAAAVLLVLTGPNVGPALGLALATAGVVLALVSPSPAIWGRPQRSDSGRTAWGVTDERQFYYPNTGLLIHGFEETANQHPWPRKVLDARDEGRLVQPFKWVGFAGYFAGPTVHLIDEYGLTDALIARLPAEADWAPGHFHRVVPDGYVETIVGNGEPNRIRDDATRRYYGQLARIIRGPLLGPERLKDIVWLNLGPGRLGPITSVH